MTPSPIQLPGARGLRIAARGLAVAIAALLLGTLATPTTRAFGQIQSGTLITLANGQVQGHQNDATREFLGIPYAEPPVGALRWRPPVAAPPWPGVLAADDYSSPCAQLPSGTGTPSESEDCLYLNVWSPDPAPPSPLPVMVWIHGGSNVVGSTADLVPFPPYDAYRFYDGHTLTQQGGVVVVTINYRLGVFGFFGHAGLATEDPSFPYAGNQGLLDQRLALEWVRDNILAFGGDPENVTIFGESAGSFDVCAHVVSPLSAGLFHRAISQSGGCTARVASAAASAAEATDVSAIVGCNGAPDELACLRSVPTTELLDAHDTLPAGFSASGVGMSIDGGFLPDHPRRLFDSGAFSHVPYLLGANSDEGTLFFIGATPIATPEEYSAVLAERYGPLAPYVEDQYPVTAFASPNAAFLRVVGDAALVCSTYDTARRASADGNRVFVYNFARVIPLPFVGLLDLGAFHGAEIAYVFGSTPSPSASDAVLASRMRQYWTSFATRGRNPRASKAPGWPRFRERSWQMLRLNALGQPKDVVKIKDFRRTECEFWSQVYELIE